jgi:hypothetical protein
MKRPAWAPRTRWRTPLLSRPRAGRAARAAASRRLPGAALAQAAVGRDHAHAHDRQAQHGAEGGRGQPAQRLVRQFGRRLLGRIGIRLRAWMRERLGLAGQEGRQRAHEGGGILRRPAGEQAAVAHDVLVQPDGAGVDQVVAQARPRGQGASGGQPAGDQHQGRVRHRRDRLAGGIESAHEGARPGRLAQQVRRDIAAGNQQAVVVGRQHIVDLPVDPHQVGWLVHVHAADPARAQGDERGLRARVLQRRQRGVQFRLLDAVRRQHGNPLAGE